MFILPCIKKVKIVRYSSIMRRDCHPWFVFMCVAVAVVVVFVVGAWQDSINQKPPTLSPISVNPLYPSSLPLLNLPDFTYLINNDVCDESVYIVVVIHSHPSNREVRDTIRQNIPDKDLRDLSMRRLFLLARAEWNDQKFYQQTPQWKISEENEENHDIIQGNFKEHYHNLTYKHIMGLQWVTRYCPDAKYILKMDDDIAVDLYEFRNKLRYRYAEKRNTILGLLQVEAKPVREKSSKWYVSESDYPAKHYPPFISGWAYAMTFDAAKSIIDESFNWPYFWIDDVHVTGTLAQRAGVKHEALNRFYTIHIDHLRCCLDLPNSTDFYCDFLAGPSEGDLEVMSKVLNHARSCYINPCRRRSMEKSVSKTCVRTKGGPLVPLGPGRGEIIRVTRMSQLIDLLSSSRN